ncbi:MAG: MFS transporter [Legionellales bacterium]|nr:MFS transporter [Legionellales bacterium]
MDKLAQLRLRFLPWVIAIAMFMDTLDSTIVGVAIPSIANSFGINPVNMKLALTSYLLSLAIFIPISGWLADRYGEKRIFLIAMVVFTLSSIACALSRNLDMLILFRLIQGFGGALMMPVGRLIILRTYPREDYVKAMGSVILPGMIGPALGPTIGGIILHITTWHWIFMINVPVGIIGVIIGWFLIPDSTQITRPPPFSWTGFILFSLGLSMVTFAMAILGDNFEWSEYALILGGVATLLLLMYAHVSKKQKYPLFNLNLFKQPTFFSAMVISFISRIGTGAMPFLLPLLLQILWGKSPLYSGIVFIFMAAGMMSTRVFINQKLLHRYGYRRLLIIDIVLLTIISMNLCWFSTPKPIFLLYITVFFIGVLTSQLYMSLGTLYPAHLNESEYSQGTSIASTIQQFSMGCGVAIAAISLHLIAKLMHIPMLTASVFFWTFVVLNTIGLTSLFFVMQLDKEVGKQ